MSNLFIKQIEVMEKLNKKMNYNYGVFNSKSEIEICKALNLCFDKIDELIEEINLLKTTKTN